MQKVPFSNKIDKDFSDMFEKLSEELNGPKNRIIEAAIEVLNSLPTVFQCILISNKQQDRQQCLNQIRKLVLPKMELDLDNPRDVLNEISGRAEARAKRSRKRTPGA